MDKTKFEVFLSVVQQGSFTAAAQEFGYTQSGITRVITSLEDELGFPLFIRSKKGVSLTKNGRTMLGPIRELVNAYQVVTQLGDDICGLVSGHLTIGAYYSITTTLMPGILRRFKNLYPGISITLLFGGNAEMRQWLSDSAVDCCFCGKPPQNMNADWMPIFEDEMLVLLPADHPYAYEDSFPLKRLAEETLILTAPNHDTDQDRVLEAAGIHPKMAFTTQDCYATYKMVDAGLGISFEQKILSREWGGSVKQIPFDPPQYISLGIAVPNKSNCSPATEKFIRCAKEELGMV